MAKWAAFPPFQPSLDPEELVGTNLALPRPLQFLRILYAVVEELGYMSVLVPKEIIWLSFVMGHLSQCNNHPHTYTITLPRSLLFPSF